MLLMDRHKDLLERGLVGIKKSLKRLNEKGSITKEAANEAIGRIRTETTMDVSCSGSARPCVYLFAVAQQWVACMRMRTLGCSNNCNCSSSAHTVCAYLRSSLSQV